MKIHCMNEVDGIVVKNLLYETFIMEIDTYRNLYCILWYTNSLQYNMWYNNIYTFNYFL